MIKRHPLQHRKTAVVAFGGNALIKPGQDGTVREQLRNAEQAASVLMKIIREGYELILVHGNGPQVGLSLLRVDAAVDRTPPVPPMPLDVCVSETQGSMGFILETALSNRLKKDAVEKPVVTMLTRVVVDENDPGFSAPTKPVGPFFTAERARRLMKEHGYLMAEDAGRGWRRVVSSPKPLGVVEIEVIRHLVSEGHIVIAGGGGGVPVCVDPAGMARGVEAVIDKDYVASLIARAVSAELFIVLTEVSHVCLDYGKPGERKLDRLTLIEAIDHYRDGQFPKGSMGPKIEAAIDYLMNGGTEALITSAACLGMALKRKSGTYIVRSETGGFIDLQPRSGD